MTAQSDRERQIISSQKLERLDPLSPQAALDAFEVAPGFRVELVAAEPLVVDPVAFCFDPQHRLLVVEMRGYSERRDSLSGRVRRLTDEDGDGRMDKAETLLDDLAWPTAVACFGDGLLIAVAPDLVYLPLDDRGEPGEPEIWFTGFGHSNVQGLPNSFRWAPDLRMHGATSNSGGDVRGLGLVDPLRLGRRDFAIDPVTRSFNAVAGGGQHGLSFDRWGNKFVCSNSDHLQQVLMTEPRPKRARRYSGVPRFRRSIAVDGPQAEVFRSSPTEAWRILRTHLRVTGRVGGPVEGGGRAAGYFTGASGVFIHEGDQWGPLQDPLAFVCDVGSNLVHRKRLEQDGLWFRGVRIDDRSEFLRSPDNWFRPVQLGSGPDGSLYIADMYREVIEHPRSLPPMIKGQLDLNSGNDRGRIWRVVRENRDVRRAAQQSLNDEPTLGLVELLRHPNSWHRRNAARLLVDRRDVGCVGPLREAASSASRPESRQLALTILAEFDGGINRAVRDAALADPHPRVRQCAVRLAGRLAERLGGIAPESSKRLANDEAIHVRFQLAYESINLAPDDGHRAQVLAAVASRDLQDPWIRWAVEGSLGNAAPLFLRELRRAVHVADGRGGRAGEELTRIPEDWFRAIAYQTLQGGDDRATLQMLRWINDESTPEQEKRALLFAMAKQLEEASLPAVPDALVAWVRNDLANEVQRRAAIGALQWPIDEARLKLIGLVSPELASPLLTMLLEPSMPLRAQKAAIRNLLADQPDLNHLVLQRFSSMTPALQNATLQALSKTRVGIRAVGEAVASGAMPVAALPPETVDLMRQSNDAEVRQAVAATRQPNLASQEVFQEYSAALAGQADVQNGKATFDRSCAVCHRPKPGADQVGPPLRSVVEKSPEQILLSIIDPNREVDPKYFQLRLVTKSGDIVMGIVAAEGDHTLTLADAEGEFHQISRDDVEFLKTTRRSLMPERLASEISPAQMRDLIAYIRSELATVSDKESY